MRDDLTEDLDLELAIHARTGPLVDVTAAHAAVLSRAGRIHRRRATMGVATAVLALTGVGSLVVGGLDPSVTTETPTAPATEVMPDATAPTTVRWVPAPPDATTTPGVDTVLVADTVIVDGARSGASVPPADDRSAIDEGVAGPSDRAPDPDGSAPVGRPDERTGTPPAATVAGAPEHPIPDPDGPAARPDRPATPDRGATPGRGATGRDHHTDDRGAPDVPADDQGDDDQGDDDERKSDRGDDDQGNDDQGDDDQGDDDQGDDDERKSDRRGPDRSRGGRADDGRPRSKPNGPAGPARSRPPSAAVTIGPADPDDSTIRPPAAAPGFRLPGAAYRVPSSAQR